jgi:hypothetical protein
LPKPKAADVRTGTWVDKSRPHGRSCFIAE